MITTSNIIDNEIKSIISFLERKSINITEEKAFEYLILQYFHFEEKVLDNIYLEIKNLITNGTNDGGIDFIYYDEEEDILHLAQCKYTQNISVQAIIDEFSKIDRTVEDFRVSNTGSYNSMLSKQLQESIDRLPDSGQIIYSLYSPSIIDHQKIVRKIKNESVNFSNEMIAIYDLEEIESKIQQVNTTINTVSKFKLQIDKAKNFLSYESSDSEGILVNISSSSVSSMYNQFKDNGLFDLNIRKYIRNKLVDEGINDSLNSDRENFWFMNNGLIIACEYFSVDGDKVYLENFSIVNGGQTTNLIGRYKGNNSREFYIPCKIVCSKKEGDTSNFFTKIAETTNSQKPIKVSDLKSNTPEMIGLNNLLRNYNIDFQIKRGESKNNKDYIKIKNEEFGQLILSFVHQKPGTARSNKKAIFENNKIYTSIFKQNYIKNINKQDFIIDVINFNDRFKRIFDKLKKDYNSGTEADILKNGYHILLALFGLLYRIQNNDIKNISDLQNDKSLLTETDFEYGTFISNYNDDDIDDNLEELIKELIIIITDKYESLFDNKQVTSVSNFFKADKKYQDDLVNQFVRKMQLKKTSENILDYSKLFTRKQR
ncbi:AIPR family protein [Gottfriedia solisilvae]|uniref:AIPR family protein n=1 Tax=Gottfriedia solisilvae TaxID=1516104 RepID=UPI003D2F05DA